MNALNSVMTLNQSATRVKQRLNQLINFKIDQLSKEMLKKAKCTETISLNESKLQEWIQILINQILQFKNSETIIKPIKQVAQTDIKNKFLDKIDLPQISLKSNGFKVRKQAVFIETDSNQITLHPKKQNQLQFTKEVCKFPKRSILKYCSTNLLKDQKTIAIIGGSKEHNNNLKSSKIQIFSLERQQLRQVNRLPSGLSSHATVYDCKKQEIYILGGNKDQSIISRGCFKWKIKQNQVEQLSCLNHPAASMSAVMWKESWIYKFGGVGQSFQDWNISPFIERYSIEGDFWEVINPKFNPSVNDILFIECGFQAKSLTVPIQSENQIWVLGGYNFKGETCDTGFCLNIQEGDSQIKQNIQIRSQNGSYSDVDILNHSLSKFGKIRELEKCAFPENRFQIVKEQSSVSLYVLQNIFERKENERKLKIENRPKKLSFRFKQ